MERKFKPTSVWPWGLSAYSLCSAHWMRAIVLETGSLSFLFSRPSPFDLQAYTSPSPTRPFWGLDPSDSVLIATRAHCLQRLPKHLLAPHSPLPALLPALLYHCFSGHWFLAARLPALLLVMWTHGWVQLRAKRSIYGGGGREKKREINLRDISECIRV